MSRNKYAGGHDTGVHATKIVLFVDCRRSCRQVSSAQGEAKKARDYLSFADTFLGEPKSNGLVVETFLKNLGQGKHEKTG